MNDHIFCARFSPRALLASATRLLLLFILYLRTAVLTLYVLRPIPFQVTVTANIGGAVTQTKSLALEDCAACTDARELHAHDPIKARTARTHTTQ